MISKCSLPWRLFSSETQKSDGQGQCGLAGTALPLRSEGGFSAACTWVARIRILELRVTGTLSLVAASMNRALIIKVIF